MNRRTDVAGHRLQEELGYSPERPTRGTGSPAECLGMTFESDEARRDYFLERLREKLKDPEFRKIEGFPLGSDEDILALSDPPYYTACPNPFVGQFVEHHGKPYDPESDDYRREPFATDVSEGKNDPLYRLPSYHTKVPPRAIQKYLLYYTEPGDVVLDAFCGTGMTGVASLQLGSPEARLLDEIGPDAAWGRRHAILVDLSPAATFTAAVLNAPLLPELAAGERGSLAKEIHDGVVPLYESKWDQESVPFDYAVWSDWGECPECTATFCLYEVVVDYDHHKLLAEYPCPNCRAILRSSSQKKVFTTEFDPWLGHAVTMAKTTMVLLSRKVGNRAVRREATEEDAKRAADVGVRQVPIVPMELPYSHMTHERNNLPQYWGISHIHHFYTRRNYYALARAATVGDPDQRRAALFAILTILDNNATRRNRFYVDARRPQGSPVGPLSNTLYVPTLQVETNIGKKLISVFKEVAQLRQSWSSGHSMVSTQSATHLQGIPDSSVDFVFTDPPFGGNINYSEQNILYEWWLRVFTNNKEEAITNSAQGKGLQEYQEIMVRCFKEYYRVLKPGRWMVVEFHNSSNAIWRAIQQALEAAGFVVATVAVLDKVHSTLHQDHKASAVNKDLAITVYKPSSELERRFELEAGTEEGVWDFVGAHLRQLPVFVPRNGAVEVVAERMNYLLFDRMVAFHVQRGVMVPISAAAFYAGLKQRYPERDGMFFAPDQVAEYDRKRVNVRELMELQLFITGEASAIQWLRQELSKKPQTFQELSPEFMKDMGWVKHEKPLELGDLLRENFLRYREGEPIPAQIVSWMKQSARYRPKIAELEARAGGIPTTGLQSHDPELIGAAKDRWYVPDPNKAQDLEKLREAALLKEFDTYKTFKGRRLKVFRLEAVRAGFKKAWGERDYATILGVAAKIPETVLQEDDKLLMWYDQALIRTGDD